MAIVPASGSGNNDQHSVLMEHLPSSQAHSDVPPIFRNADGSQWKIFVEAGGIVGRPRLIRILKRAEAVVCSDPKQAQVILVDSTSIQGRLFIRDWGNDGNKVVLEHSWVKASVAAGRVLNEDDNWGGCLTSDDGLPILMEDSGDTINHPQLVTTGLETFEQHIESTPTISQVQRLTSSSDMVQDPRNPGQSELMCPPPDPCIPLNQHLPYGIPPQNFPQISASPLSQSFPHLLNMMPPNVQFQSGSNGVVSNPPQVMNLMNLLDPRYFSYPVPSNVVPWNLPSGQHTSPPLLFNQPIGSTVGQQSPDFRSIPGLSTASNDSSRSHTLSQDPPDPLPSTSAFRPSLHRKSPDTFKVTPKGNRSVSTSPSSASRFSIPNLSATSASPRPPTHPSSSLFTSEKGEELSFFVQIDLNKRSSVVSAIKKNGGKITNNHTTADYAVLYSRSTTFNDLLKSTLAANRPAVNASFVLDCVAQNKLVDPSQYVFEISGGPRGKRKRVKLEDDDGMGERVEKKPSERTSRPAERWMVMTTSPKKSDNTSISNGQPRSLSPTPPPEYTRISLSGGGGYRFSEHERNYVSRYVKVLLDRDHLMPVNAMAQCLFRKMNNHSMKSWRNFLTQTFGEELETLRKRASIAYRKERNSTRSLDARDNQEASGDDGSNLPSVDQESLRRQFLEEDLETVSRYFAIGGGDSSEDHDDVIWARLTEQVKCKTMATWEGFYNEYHTEVLARYKGLTQANNEDTYSNLR